MQYSPSGMCLECLKSKADICQQVQREGAIQFCRGCERYLRPPWAKIQLESEEMLMFCLKKIKGLKGLSVVDAGFLYTEPHSRRIKVRVAVQKEVFENTTLEQTFVTEFVVSNLQCDDCKKSYTPHLWKAKVQVRQRVDHQKTFYYLEQLLLKSQAHAQAIGIVQSDRGLDLQFSNNAHAGRLVDFIQSVLPVQIKHSKTLVSHDMNNNVHNYKVTHSVDVIPICTDDLLLLPNNFNLGGIGPFVVCFKIAKSVHIINPFTLQIAEINPVRFWKSPFKPYAHQKALSEFIVLDIEDLKNSGSMDLDAKRKKFKLVEVEVARNDYVGVPGNSFRINTHLGNILRVGDTVLGYDLQRIINSFQEIDLSNLPDVVLIKKQYSARKSRKRVFKLERMDIDKEEEKDYEEFLDEIEENPEMRANMNLYRNKEVRTEDIGNPEDDTFPAIQLEELIGKLNIHDN